MSPDVLKSSISSMIGGVCFLVFGLWMVKTGSPILIHNYHIAQIPRNRIPYVAKLIGFGLAAAGVGLVLAGIIAFMFKIPVSASESFALPLVLIFFGISISLLTVIIFTFQPWS